MTAPTPAQIEAAAQALFFCQNAIMHNHQLEWRKANKKLWQECAAAALTAAAEVKQNDFVLCYKGVPDAWRVKPEDLK